MPLGIRQNALTHNRKRKRVLDRMPTYEGSCSFLGLVSATGMLRRGDAK